MEELHFDLIDFFGLDPLGELICHVDSQCTVPGTSPAEWTTHPVEVRLVPLRELNGDLINC